MFDRHLVSYPQLVGLFGQFILGFHKRGELTQAAVHRVLSAKPAFEYIAAHATIADAIEGVELLARIISVPGGVTRLRAWAEHEFRNQA